ncbi:MAG: hypothetical protein C0444_03105 [Microbacterium sp.]|nr:hypothetical protein [Microbacterium sp.]MBA4345638.1 hypothetical protein [Microbacterium sp.]
MEKNDDTTPEASEPSAEEQEQANGNSAARGAWMATGITFFAVGVVFTIVMPDNIALGITFLGVGVVFYSLAGTVGAKPEATPAIDAEPAVDGDAASGPGADSGAGKR